MGVCGQFLQFAEDPPQLTGALYLFHKFCGRLRFLSRSQLIRKIIEYRRGIDGSRIRIFPHQQIQKSSLSLSIPPDKSQFPVGVNGKGYLLKGVVKASFIGKSQIRYIYLRHSHSSLQVPFTDIKNRTICRQIVPLYSITS